jgi:hypothetical protein
METAGFGDTFTSKGKSWGKGALVKKARDRLLVRGKKVLFCKERKKKTCKTLEAKQNGPS